MRFRRSAWAASAVLAAGLAFAMPQAAHATTDACHSAFGEQCNTFAGRDQEGTPHAVFFAVKGRTAAVNNVVIGYGANGSQDPATDFVKVAHRGTVPGLPQSTSNTLSYSFVYTPDGHWTSLCLADTGTHALVLRSCNALQWQRFIAQQAATDGPPTAVSSTGFQGDRIRDASNSEGFALMNVAYHRYIQDTSTVSSLSPATPDTRILVLSPTPVTFPQSMIWNWAS